MKAQIQQCYARYKQKTTQEKSAIWAAGATIVIAFFTIVLAYIACQQKQEMHRQSELQESAIRPWVSLADENAVTIAPVPITFNVDQSGANIVLDYRLSNSGRPMSYRVRYDGGKSDTQAEHMPQAIIDPSDAKSLLSNIGCIVYRSTSETGRLNKTPFIGDLSIRDLKRPETGSFLIVGAAD